MSAHKTPQTFRLSAETRAIIEAIAEAREGLTMTRVIENAVERYGRSVLGRRMADLVAVRLLLRENNKARGARWNRP